MKRATLLSARKLAVSRRHIAIKFLQHSIGTYNEQRYRDNYARYDRLVEKLDKRLLVTAAGDAC